MTVQEVIDKIDRMYPNAFNNEEKLGWINEIEGLICTELSKSYSYIETTLSSNDSLIVLPEGISFYDVECVFINSKQVPKVDFKSYNIFGVGKNIIVSQTKPITIRIVYIARHRPIYEVNTPFNSLVFTHNSIVFENSDIPFKTGDTILVSGSGVLANNKQVVVLEVNDNILTVPDGTFENATSNANLKLVLNQNLRTPPPYDKIYIEYLQAKIDQYNRDFDAYENSMTIFNTTWVAFSKYLKQRMPQNENSCFKNYW